MRDFNMALSAQKPNHVRAAKKSSLPAGKPRVKQRTFGQRAKNLSTTKSQLFFLQEGA
jgi:hypothetical protein